MTLEWDEGFENGIRVRFGVRFRKNSVVVVGVVGWHSVEVVRVVWG